MEKRVEMVDGSKEKGKGEDSDTFFPLPSGYQVFPTYRDVRGRSLKNP